MEQRVVVIGAGIVGASLAYHLADRGAKVTVVEAQGIASGVTGTSFAWLNTTHAGPAPDPIAPLRGAALAEYHRLEAELPGVAVRWTGALTYGPQAPATNRVSREQILALEPNLRHPPAQAAFAAEQGALDAVQTTHALIAGAQARGASVLTHTRVLGFTVQAATVTGVETVAGRIAADMVVLAAGTGTAALAAMLDVALPIDASPSIFIRYPATPGLVRTLISNAHMEVRQAADGTLLAAEDYVDDALENRPMAIAARTAGALCSELRGVTALEPTLACIGLRPMPADGVPVIGGLPGIDGVYVCAMHPGVVLAAVVGRLASEEIVDGLQNPALQVCRPGRFL